MTSEYLMDRLVDDELDEAQRRRLLRELEDRPDGWRTCALAFLEAQAWRRNFKSAVGTDDGVFVGQGNKSASSRSPAADSANKMPRFAAFYRPSLAAAVLIAFTTGFATQRFLPQNLADRHLPVASSPEASHFGLQLRHVYDTEAAAAHQELTPESLTPFAAPESVETPSVPDRQYASALREKMLLMLQRSGSHVRRQQRVVPIHLRDGRRVILPVEDVYVTPVSGNTY